MSTSKVLPLTDFRGRRERRRDLVLALHVSDRHRERILRHLWSALTLTGADRAAAVWVDEYGPGIVHPHAVLDVGADTPRTGFSIELLRRTWQEGVPGVLDVPSDQRPGLVFPGDVPRSSFVVSLGSDGLRAWFVVVDSSSTRSPIDPQVVEELLFLAGECAGILLHRDMDLPSESGPGARDRKFGAWPVLRDAPEEEGERLPNRRIACRFLVARAVQSLLEDDLAAAAEEIEERVGGVRREIDDFPGSDPERRAWEAVLEALESGDRTALAAALLETAGKAEDHAHWHGAAELYRTAREVATAASVAEVWLDATRRLARVSRNLGDWTQAMELYSVARETARAVGDRGREARAMDGLAGLHIVRGNVPRAREILDETLPIAEASADGDVRGVVFHSMMTVAHTERRLASAARWGWRAVRAYRRDEGERLRSLTALAGVFLEGRELEAAEDGFAIVADRVQDSMVRLYALAGLALVSAHRRHADEYRRRLAVLEGAGLDGGTPELRAEVLLECGDGFLVLDEEDEARRWYHRAVEVAEAHGVNEFLIRAEEALRRLDRVRGEDDAQAATAPGVLEERELEEIRGGLKRMRRETAGAT